jgi:phage shock protein A
MSEQVLTQILEHMQLLHKGQEQIHQRLDKMDARLERVEIRLDQLDTRMGQVEARLGQVEARLEHVEALAADIPLIRRAVLETNEDVKRFELHLQRHDTDIGNHEYSIKIIHYDQLKLHTEIEKLKNR